VSAGTFVDGDVVDVRFLRAGDDGKGGPPGIEGPFGYSGIKMKFDTDTSDADSGAGKIYFNNATYSSATVVYVDDVDADSVNINAFVDSWDDGSGPISGTILVRHIDDTAVYAEFDVTGAVTSASTYSKVAVAHTISAGTFADGQLVDVRFIRSGLVGSGGPQGPRGVYGHSGVKMLWDSDTSDADSGAGKIYFNNGTLSSVTVVYVDDVDNDGVNINSFVDSWDDGSGPISGTILVRDILTPTIYAEYDVTGAVTSASTYSKVAVTHVVSSGTFVDGKKMDVRFVRSGLIGSGGPPGPTGPTGGGLANVVEDGSPQLGGFLDANGNYIQMQKGGDIASASPTVIDTDGDFFICTGTTNFSAFTVAADRHFFLEFAAVLTMAHGNGELDLPGAANITTAASDIGEFVSTASNVVTCVNYTKRDGTAVVFADNAVDETKLKDALIGDFTDVTVTAADTFLYGDTTDSGNTKKDTIQGILDLAGGGGWEWVCQQVASGSSALAFTNMADGYDYLYVGADIIHATDGATFDAQIGVAGPTYRSSGYLGGQSRINSTSGTSVCGAMTAYFAINQTGSGGGSGANEGTVAFRMEIGNNPANSGTKTTGIIQATNLDTGGYYDVCTHGGKYNTAEANTAINFEMSSGDITSGTIDQFKRARS
jgi:hypothetical protein